MSYNNSQKEFILNSFIYHNVDVLEKLAGYELSKYGLEVPCNKRKVDIMLKNNNNSALCYCETQISKVNDIHLKQIEWLINNVYSSDYVVIWFATEFTQDIIDEVTKYINNVKKNIEFLAIKINNDAVDILKELNQIKPTEIWDPMNKRLRINSLLELRYRYYKKQTDCTNNIIIDKIDKDCKELLLDNILREIRQQAYYFLTVHRYKKYIYNSFVIGSGIQDIEYMIGVNKYDYVYIELRFLGKNKNVYRDLCKKIDKINFLLKEKIVWNSEIKKIGFYIPYEKNNHQKIALKIGEVTNKFIKVFSEYL